MSASDLPRPAASGATRCWTLESADGPVDVEVRAAEDATLADVAGALCRALSLPSVLLWSGSAALPADTPLSHPALLHGTVLGLGRPGSRPDRVPSGALELQVCGGPDAGRCAPLGQGTVVLGRSADCGVRLADPDVSRRHARVTVADGRVTVADLGSANGSTLDGQPGAPVPVGPEGVDWPVGSVLRIGSSALRLTGPRGVPLQQAPAAGGRVLVRPMASPPRPPAARAVRLPAPPVEGPRRRLGALAVALPAVGGVLMAWLLSTPQFLFFALLSPLVAIAGWASDRIGGRRTHRAALADHAVARALAEADLRAAVAADLANRDDQHPDPARLAAAARRRVGPLWSAPWSAVVPVVRLGTGPGPTAATAVQPDGTRVPVSADHVPVTVPLGAGGPSSVVGPREPALAVARSVLCQLAVSGSPAQWRLWIVCDRPRSAAWRWTRWLPHLAGVVLGDDPAGAGRLATAVSEAVSEAATGGSAGVPPGTPRLVVLVDGPVPPAAAPALSAALVGGDRVLCLQLAATSSALPLPSGAVLAVTGETGSAGQLRSADPEPQRLLVLDAVAADTAAQVARDLAGLTVPMGSRGLPETIRLLDLPGEGLRPAPAGGAAGTWDRSRRRLSAVLGVTGAGPVRVDLVTDGPHALVAGTTGSGKSELLQTLVAGLALHHPPDRCSFLLVDYKGGAAFGEAAALPHTTGLLTDLDPQSTARALRSLAAELARRERLLAEHGVRDVADLPGTAAAARLVIVVDEFATLAEELPGFVTGLVGIAQRGRSLGVHLVLATQRPAGVVSPEIRANCSLRICLRTTDEADARDVLGSPLAAHLPPERPGRGYLRTGSAAPLLFQSARVSGTAPEDGPAVSARRSPWPPAAAGPVVDPTTTTGATDLQRLVRAAMSGARSDGSPAPHRPWLPPLPDRLGAEDLDRWATGDHPERLRIGLVDRPDVQRQDPLELDLASGGGWLVVGGARSGRTTFLRTVLGEAVAQLPPDRLHVHVLDHGGGALAQRVAGSPHAGTAVGRDDSFRSVRLLARLAEEVDRRRGAGDADRPFLLVLVDGYESLAAQLDEAEPLTGSAGLLRLVRDGAAVGVTVVLSAERGVPGGRLAAAVRTRLVLPLPDRADYAVAGIPGRAVPGHRPPGRALVGEDAVECQLALPREEPRSWPHRTGSEPTDRPVSVVALPPDPELPLPEAAPAGPVTGLEVPLGPGGDDGAPVGLDLLRSGGLLVVGPPGSGRSSALRAAAAHCAAAGARVAELVPPGDLGEGPTGQPLHDRVHGLDRTDPAALRAWLGDRPGTGPVVVVADDLPTLPEAVADLLGPPATASGSAGGAGVLLLASGTAADLAASFRGPAVALRRNRTALLLSPAAGDAELLGLRLPRTPVPVRPGSGWLVSHAATVRVQVARHRRAAAPRDPSPGPAPDGR